MSSMIDDWKTDTLLTESDPQVMNKSGFWAGVLMVPMVAALTVVLYVAYTGLVMLFAKESVSVDGTVKMMGFMDYFEPVLNYIWTLLKWSPTTLLFGVLGVVMARVQINSTKRDKPLTVYFSMIFFAVIFLVGGFLVVMRSGINFPWWATAFLALMGAGVIGFTVFAFWFALYKSFMYRFSTGTLMDILDAIESHTGLANKVRINWDRHTGKVILRGPVDSQATRKQAEDLIAAIPGVKEVENKTRATSR